MIIVASPDKPFIYNMKGLPKRRVILPMYQHEIDALYKAVEDSAQSEVEGPLTWDAEGILTFVRAVVSSVLVSSVADDSDLFRNGCDRSVTFAQFDVHPFVTLFTVSRPHGFGIRFSVHFAKDRQRLLSAYP